MRTKDISNYWAAEIRTSIIIANEQIGEDPREELEAFDRFLKAAGNPKDPKASKPMESKDARLIIVDGGVALYQAPDGVKIASIAEHGGILYVALQNASGKSTLMTFDLSEVGVK